MDEVNRVVNVQPCISNTAISTCPVEGAGDKIVACLFSNSLIATWSVQSIRIEVFYIPCDISPNAYWNGEIGTFHQSSFIESTSLLRSNSAVLYLQSIY